MNIAARLSISKVASLLLLAVGLLQAPSAMAQLDVPKVEIPLILPEHPRLLINNEEIENLKAWEAKTPWLKEAIDDLVAGLLKQVDSPNLPNENRGQNSGIATQAHRFALAYVLRGDRRFAEAAAKILKEYVKVFPDYKPTGMKGLATSSALGESVWALNAASAYDLIYQADVLTDEDKTAIEKVFKASGEVMRHCNHKARSNWRGRAIAGIAVLGFCINDRSLIEEAVNGARNEHGDLIRDGFTHHLAWSILGDGVFYERAMGYHFYTLDGYTILAEAARHSNVDLWNLQVPGHRIDAGTDIERKYGGPGSKSLKSMFDAPFYEAFSDGSLVRLGNSKEDLLERKSCYERAYHAYKDPKYAWLINRPSGQAHAEKMLKPEEINPGHRLGLAKTMKAKSHGMLSPMELVWLVPDLPEGKFDHSQDARIGVTGQHTNFCTLLPNGGITVLRQHAKPDAVGVQMTFGNWGSSHTHAELLSIAISARGNILAGESRYHSYGHADFNSWDRQTIVHNTVTVDQKSQYPQGDLDNRWVVESDGKEAHCRPIFFHPGNNFKAFRATCDTAYEGVLMDRTMVLVDDVIVDFYRCRSDESHQYDFALHVDGRLESSTPKLSEPTPGPLAEAFGYRHLKQVRRAETTGPGSELTFAGRKDGTKMRVQLLSQGPSEVVTTIGYPNPAGNAKQALLLRKQGKNLDFVDVVSFPKDKETVTARRLTDTPAGVLGVELTHADGTIEIVLSAEKAMAFEYAGQPLTGQLVLLRKTKDGKTQVADLVP